LDVINSQHILEDGLDYDNFAKADISCWDTQARARVFKDDILIYTTGANIGRTAIYLNDKQAIASNHVNILRLNVSNKLYAAFVLNSLVGRLQTEKLSAGSAQQELYPKDIEQFYIPFVDNACQTRIAEKIRQSFTLRAQSQHLLALAQRAVETAIEHSEPKAMELLQKGAIP